MADRQENEIRVQLGFQDGGFQQFDNVERYAWETIPEVHGNVLRLYHTHAARTTIVPGAAAIVIMEDYDPV